MIEKCTNCNKPLNTLESAWALDGELFCSNSCAILNHDVKTCEALMASSDNIELSDAGIERVYVAKQWSLNQHGYNPRILEWIAEYEFEVDDVIVVESNYTGDWLKVKVLEKEAEVSTSARGETLHGYYLSIIEYIDVA